jgi:hypothetical protein
MSEETSADKPVETTQEEDKEVSPHSENEEKQEKEETDDSTVKTSTDAPETRDDASSYGDPSDSEVSTLIQIPAY